MADNGDGTATENESDMDFSSSLSNISNMSSTGRNSEKGQLSPLGFLAMVYFLVCGSSYGTEDLSSAIPPLFCILGIILVPWVWSLPIALMTAEMATTWPHESGFVYWTKKAWGNFGSFMDGWLLTWIVIIDQAIYPRIFVDYLHNVYHFDYWPSWGICVAFIFFCFLVNLLGVTSVGISSTIFSILALLPFLIFFILGFLSKDFDFYRIGSVEGKWNVGTYMAVLVWSTCGYDYAGFLGTDLKNPKKNFPRVMAAAVLLMTLTYMLPIFTTITTYPEIENVTEGFYPVIASHLGFGEWLKWCMVVGGFVSCAGTFNAYLRTTSTALRGMAKKKQAPAIFNAFRKIKVPLVALIFYCLTTCVLTLFDFTVLVEIESILFCVHSVVLASDLVKLRFKRPNKVRPFKIPFGMPGAFIASSFPVIISLLLVAFSGWLHPLIAFLVLVWGAIVYWISFIVLKMPVVPHDPEQTAPNDPSDPSSNYDPVPTILDEEAILLQQESKKPPKQQQEEEEEDTPESK